MRRFNREPAFISIILVSEIDVGTDAVVAKTSSDDLLARLGFGENLEIKNLLLLVLFVCLLKRGLYPFHPSMVHSLG